jgi:hypothetical protein
MFVLSLFDKMWRPEVTEAEALNMMEQVSVAWQLRGGRCMCTTCVRCS